MDMQLWPV